MAFKEFESSLESSFLYFSLSNSLRSTIYVFDKCYNLTITSSVSFFKLTNISSMVLGPMAGYKLNQDYDKD